MSVILLILGILVAAAGIAAIGFGIPNNDFGLSATLFGAGTTALVGGLVLIGLSAVVTELGRVAEGLKARNGASRSNTAGRQGDALEPVVQSITQPVIQPAAPLGLPPVGQPTAQPIAPPAALPPSPAPALRTAPPQPSAPVRPDAPARQPHPADAYQPAPAPSAVEVSAAAIERLRSSIPRTERPRAEPTGVGDMDEAPLSPNGAAHHPPPRAPEALPPDPRITGEDRTSEAAVEALKASRLDFLFRSKPASRTAPQPQQENLDAYWPTDARQQGRAAPPAGEPRPRADQRSDQIERQAPYAPPPPEPALHAPAPEPPMPAILKSGVVDGMAYTLYADGSIEAKLPHGTVRFGSIAELRAHIESNS